MKYCDYDILCFHSVKFCETLRSTGRFEEIPPDHWTLFSVKDSETDYKWLNYHNPSFKKKYLKISSIRKIFHMKKTFKDF